MRARRGSARITLTVLLSTAIGVLIFLSVGTVLAITAGANFRNTFELMRGSGELTMGNLETSLSDYIEPARDLAEHIVQLVADGLIDLKDKQQVETMLLAALGAAPQISGAVIWDRERRPVAVLEEDGVPRTFRFDTVDNQGLTAETAPRAPRWSEPISLENGTFIIMETALYRDGEYVGAFATGIDTAHLSSLVQRIGNELGMTAFILYEAADGERVLAHPDMQVDDTDWVPAPMPLRDLQLETLAAFGDPILAAYPERDSGLPGSASYDYGIVERNGEDYLILTREISDYGPTPWRIGIYTNTEDIGDQFRRLIGSTAVGLGIMVLAILLGFLLARYLARPIIQLSKAEAQVGALDLDNIEIPKASAIREINDQITAFHRMLDGLRTFETYVPKALVKRIISQSGSGAIESTESNLTLMFTDIIGYSKMAERRPPGDVARLLNEHFTVVDRCIETEGGTIDKYIGDSVMAFWGAPDTPGDHAARACRAALMIKQRLRDAKKTKPDDPQLRIKIAIHCGPLIVGNIGAPGRINYTVVGDTVNTCQRMEKLCGEIDDGISAATIVVSEEITREVEDRFCFTPVGSFHVKGKTRPVNVFKLEGEAGDAATKRRQLLPEIQDKAADQAL